MYAVVLDACVLVPYPLFDLLLRTAEEGLYRPMWSAEILDEVHRTNVNKLGLSEEAATRRIAAMQHAFPDAEVTGHMALVPAMQNDPKDRHVLAAAVASDAAAVITANLKDFPAEVLAPHGIEAIHPDAFLLDLLDLNEVAVRRAVNAMFAANSKPPKSVETLVEFARRTTPNFVAELLARTRSSESAAR